MKKIITVFIILASTIFYFSYDRFTNDLSSNIPYAIYSKEEDNALEVINGGSEEFMSEQNIKRFIEYIDEKDLNVYTYDRYSQYEYYVRTKDPDFLKYINTINGPPKELKQFDTYSTDAIDNEHKMFGDLELKYKVKSLEEFPFGFSSNFLLTTNGNVKMASIKSEVLNHLQEFFMREVENHNFYPISNFVQNFIIISVAIILSIFILDDDSKSKDMINTLYLEGYTDSKIFFRFFFIKLKGLIVVPITYITLFTIFIKLPIFKTVLFWEVVFGYSLIGFGVFFIITSLIFFYIKERIRLLRNKKVILLGGYNLPILIVQSIVFATAIILVIDCMSFIHQIKHVKSLVEYEATENYYHLASNNFYFNRNDDDDEFQKYGKVELQIINELMLENRGFIFIYIGNQSLDLHNNAWLPEEYFLNYVDDNYVKTFIDPSYDNDSSTYIYIPQTYKNNSTVGSLGSFIEIDKRTPMFTGPVADEQLEEIPSIYVSLNYEDYKKIPGVIPFADYIAVVIYSESDEVETTNVVKEKYAKYGQEFKGNAYSVHEFYTGLVTGSKMFLKKAGQILIMSVISLIVMFIFFFRDFKQRLTINFGNQMLKRNIVISLLIVMTLVIILGLILNRFLFSEIEIPYYDYY